MSALDTFFSLETLYRIFTWFIMGTAFLLLLPIFSIGCLWLPDKFGWLAYIIIPSFYALLLYLGWKSRIKKDVVVEPAKNSRLQSSLIWLGIAMIVFAVLRTSVFSCSLSYFLGIDVEYLLLTFLLLAAVLMIIFLPFKKHAKGMNFAYDGIIVGMIINLAVVVFSPVNYDYQGEKLPPNYKMPTPMQSRFFPDNAYNIEVRGKSVFVADSVEWNCNVSEKDFEKFRKKHSYNFVLNCTDINYSDDNWQKPYYFYNNRHANGGGLTMRYSVPEQKLYGQYSNR